MTYPPVSLPKNIPSPLTLTTDFGQGDPYAGSMKGVILDILPWAKIIDITHVIEPQNILQAAYVLSIAAPHFPLKTVHVVVVDPGVGTERRAIAVYTDRACYVGPDNGVFSRVYRYEKLVTIRELSNPFYRLPTVSHTFHGRDIFAPFAAYIANGVPAKSLGPEVTDPVEIPIPLPERRADGSVTGQIIYTDHFGNLISDIPLEWLQEHDVWLFEIGGHIMNGIHHTYGSVESGKVAVLGSSAGLVEIAVRNGNAARSLGVGTGETILARPAV